MGFTSLLIGEPFASGAVDQLFGALEVADAKLGAAIVAEIELRKVAVQVSLTAMLVDADHAALEH